MREVAIECAECLTSLHDCGGDPCIRDQIALDLLRQTQLSHVGPRGRLGLKLHAGATQQAVDKVTHISQGVGLFENFGVAGDAHEASHHHAHE